jgi:hypothetical protein
MTREETISKLRASSKVRFSTEVNGGVLLLTMDKPLAESLEKRGARVIWYDRTPRETRLGGQPRMDADVFIGESFRA